jgi:hypothetical protein
MRHCEKDEHLNFKKRKKSAWLAYYWNSPHPQFEKAGKELTKDKQDFGDKWLSSKGK